MSNEVVKSRLALGMVFAVVSLTAGASLLFGLETAAMKLPPDFAAVAERLPAKGYGGANRGRFEIGDFHGEFTRIESRLAVFDPLYASNRGKSSFTLEGPGIDGPIGAECGFKQNVVTVGVVTLDAKKLAYVCEIVGGSGQSIGSLTLGEPKPAGFKERLLARERRLGEAQVDSIRIGIESVHEYDRSKLGSQTPVGYLLFLDSKIVGAIELTDANPTFLFHAEVAPEIRRATLVAALGLSVLRDPAESALAD
jgi:hypothetical protein